VCLNQLACPLCGRFVSLRHFDPRGFESDIYAVNRTGLGRGKGFAVSETFSVLGDRAITGPIASRCREILGLIEGQKPPRYGEVSFLKAEFEAWKREALEGRKVLEDLRAEVAELEGQSRYWRNEALNLRRIGEDHAAELAGLEDETRRWRTMVAELTSEIKRLESYLGDQDEDDEEDEEETLAMEEMQEILDRINASANTDFVYLSDAVDFLLEGG